MSKIQVNTEAVPMSAKPAKPRMAVVAGILWTIWVVGGVLYTAWSYMRVRSTFTDNFDTTDFLYWGGCEFVLSVSLVLFCGVAAVGALTGKSNSLALFGVMSLALSLVVVIVSAQHLFLIAVPIEERLGLHGLALHDAMVLAVKRLVFLSGAIVAGVLALLVNPRYQEWYRSTRV